MSPTEHRLSVGSERETKGKKGVNKREQLYCGGITERRIFIIKTKKGGGRQQYFL